MKKLHDFYKKHIVVFFIALGVMLYLFINAALIAFSYFSGGGIESLKRDLALFAVPWGIVAAAFLIFVYAKTENVFLRLASAFGFVAVAVLLIVFAIPNI